MPMETGAGAALHWCLREELEGRFICFRSITSSRYLWIFYLFSALGLQIKAPRALVRLKANK